MCRLLGANVIEFFFTPSSSSNANTNERREETGAASLEERTNVRNFAGGNKPFWTGKALLREGEFSKWWRRDWKRRDWSVIPIFILLGASRARGAIWESMNISYSLDSVYI